ncbi:MAG: acetylglutamate kinase [Prevotellaceae bacterium]|jgi:acetylglutamate kinase|nr:acetylglutamate kinase [Prevotellaceae bacterium]
MEISVIKIGGNVIDHEASLNTFLEKFAAREGKKILVHGGGKLATRLSARLDIPTKMIDGRRVTDEQTIEVVTMVYAGLVNKKITARLQSLGCNAIGLSGADAGLIRAVKRSPEPVDFGLVGDLSPSSIDAPRLLDFLDSGLTPVFCSITANQQGVLLNCNADVIARSLAVALSPTNTVKLIYCFEKKGLLANVDDDNSVIPKISRANCEQLKNAGVISGGMIPKIDSAFDAIAAGVSEVIIKSASDLDNSEGTVVSDF